MNSIESRSNSNKIECKKVIEDILSEEDVNIITSMSVSSIIYDELYKRITQDILERTENELFRKTELLKLLASNNMFNETIKSLREHGLYIQVISFTEVDKKELIYYIEEIAKTKKTKASLRTVDPIKYENAKCNFNILIQIYRKKKLLKQVKSMRIKPRLRNSILFKKQGFEGVLRMKEVIETYDENKVYFDRIKAFFK